MQGGLYVEEYAANAAVGSPSARGLQHSTSFGAAGQLFPNAGRRSWNASQQFSSKSAARKQKRAFLSAALAGFLAGFCAVSAGLIDLKDILDIKDLRKFKFPEGLLADGTPTAGFYPQDPYQQQSLQQPPYALQPAQQPFLQQPPQQAQLHQQLEPEPQLPQPEPQQQQEQQPEEPQQHPQPPSQQHPEPQPQPVPEPPPQQPQPVLQPPPQQPQPVPETSSQQSQLVSPRFSQQSQPVSPRLSQQSQLVSPRFSRQSQRPTHLPAQVSPRQEQLTAYTGYGAQQFQYAGEGVDDWEEGEAVYDDHYYGGPSRGLDDPIDIIPGPMTEEGLAAVIDDLSFYVVGLMTNLRSVHEEARLQFASEYMHITEGPQRVRTVFEYFARIINGVRSVAPPPNAHYRVVAAHKVRCAFLIALLSAASERLRGIDDRFGMVENFWVYSAPLDDEMESRLSYVPGDRQPSRESLVSVKSLGRGSTESLVSLVSGGGWRGSRDSLKSVGRGSTESLASIGVGEDEEDIVEYSVFLKRVNKHLEGLDDKISEAERKEAKKKKKKKKKNKKHKYVTRFQALRFADVLSATRTRLDEDKRIPSEIKMVFMKEAGPEGEQGSTGNVQRRVDNQSRYEVTGAKGYAWHLARRAQTEVDCVLAEATQFFIEFGVELIETRKCTYHLPSYLSNVADLWTGTEVENALHSISEKEREVRAKAQQIKLSALRAADDVLEHSTSRRGYVDVLLLQAGIALL